MHCERVSVKIIYIWIYHDIGRNRHYAKLANYTFCVKMWHCDVKFSLASQKDLCWWTVYEVCKKKKSVAHSKKEASNWILTNLF